MFGMQIVFFLEVWNKWASLVNDESSLEKYHQNKRKNNPIIISIPCFIKIQ